MTRENDLPEREYARRAELLEPRIAPYRIFLAEEGMDSVQRRMFTDGIQVAEATVITNELLGWEPGGVGRSLELVMRAHDRAGSGWIGYLRRNPDEAAKILDELRE